MSHLQTFTCEACGAVLGAVSARALRLRGAHVDISRSGVAVVRCPSCGDARIWEPRPVLQSKADVAK